jgi:hypothetical protein
MKWWQMLLRLSANFSNCRSVGTCRAGLVIDYVRLLCKACIPCLVYQCSVNVVFLPPPSSVSCRQGHLKVNEAMVQWNQGAWKLARCCHSRGCWGPSLYDHMPQTPLLKGQGPTSSAMLASCSRNLHLDHPHTHPIVQHKSSHL